MMFDREVFFLTDIAFGMEIQNSKANDYPQYVKKFRQTIERIHEEAHRNFAVAQGQQEGDYYLKLAENTYEIGDLVYKLQ